MKLLKQSTWLRLVNASLKLINFLPLFLSEMNPSASSLLRELIIQLKIKTLNIDHSLFGQQEGWIRSWYAGCSMLLSVAEVGQLLQINYVQHVTQNQYLVLAQWITIDVGLAGVIAIVLSTCIGAMLLHLLLIYGQNVSSLEPWFQGHICIMCRYSVFSCFNMY